MKIIKYKKIKSNIYQVDFDEESLILYESVITKHELLLKKKISSKELDIIKRENKKYQNYDLAIKYLEKKMRSKKEVEKYLKKENVVEEEIKEILDRLEQIGYIKEEAYIESYINDKIRFSKDGPEKIKKELEELGLDHESVLIKINNIPKKIWEEKIEKIASKKIESNHNKSKELLKRQIIQYCINLGYPYEWLEKVKDYNINTNSNIIKREKEKLTKKLSRKYPKDNLEFQIKLKLYQKGFSKEEIEEQID